MSFSTRHIHPTLPLPPSRIIVLVGMPASGKSTLGPLLAARMGRAFIDLDRAIEREAKCSATEFFQRYGEKDFRRLEHTILSDLSEQTGQPGVIAAGGGIQDNPLTQKLLLAQTTTIWLRAKISTLVKRMADSNNRPLTIGCDRGEELRKRFHRRKALYKSAQVKVVGDLPPKDLNRLIERVEGASATNPPAYLQLLQALLELTEG